MRLVAGVGCILLLSVSVYGLMQISIWAVFSLMKRELLFPGSSCQVPLHVCFCVPLVTACETVVFAGNMWLTF